MKKKEVTEIECECGKKIKGFSEHHARQNLTIHQRTSKEHQERIQLKKKWTREQKQNS